MGSISESVDDLLCDFEISLRAANKSPKTIRSYLAAANKFHAFCEANDRPVDPTQARRRDVEAFNAHNLEINTSSTAASYHRYLQQWFRWLEREELIEVSPMAKMTPPKIDEKVIDVVSPSDVKALVKACQGKTYDDRRDLALLYFMLDTGARLAEVAGLQIADVDARGGKALVHGKGGRDRWVPLTAPTCEALRRFERLRRRHNRSADSAYWLGPKGGLTDSGITQVLRRRCNQADIPKIHAHQLRHTFAHAMKTQGVSDEEIMSIGGWRSDQMLRRYGSSAAQERAFATHRAKGPVVVLTETLEQK